MGWMRIGLTADEQRIVQSERESHTDAVVRRRLWVLWLLHCGLKREQAAKVVGVAVSSVQRDVSLYRRGGLEALQTSGREYQPTSELAGHREQIRQSLEQQPARTIAEACHRIKELTGVERGPTQVRRFLKGLGLKWQMVRAIPVPPKKTWRNMPLTKPCFWTKN
ncbi:MAG: transposase [Planctomycetaceae bacterium]|nr:transposase [Planctomycetaceae bacterium]